MYEPQLRGWWGRNWKWLVPVGCLGSFVIAFAFCAGIAGIVFASLRSSWACTEGLNLALHNKTVCEELGEPVAAGWLVSGSIKVTTSSGNADLAIPLWGSRRKGTLYVVARKELGEWKLERAVVEVEGKPTRIDLLAKDRST